MSANKATEFLESPRYKQMLDAIGKLYRESEDKDLVFIDYSGLHGSLCLGYDVTECVENYVSDPELTREIMYHVDKVEYLDGRYYLRDIRVDIEKGEETYRHVKALAELLRHRRESSITEGTEPTTKRELARRLLNMGSVTIKDVWSKDRKDSEPAYDSMIDYYEIRCSALREAVIRLSAEEFFERWYERISPDVSYQLSIDDDLDIIATVVG